MEAAPYARMFFQDKLRPRYCVFFQLQVMSFSTASKSRSVTEMRHLSDP